jgi:hypothetical protein
VQFDVQYKPQALGKGPKDPPGICEKQVSVTYNAAQLSHTIGKKRLGDFVLMFAVLNVIATVRSSLPHGYLFP